MTVVKVCGLTNLDDVQEATYAGAQFLGFIFARSSPRKVSSADVKTMTRVLAPLCKTVAVFKDDSLQDIVWITSELKVDFVQLHGDESPEFCAQVPYPVIKVLEIESSTDKAELSMKVHKYRDCVDYLLFDRPKVSVESTSNEEWLETALKVIEGCEDLPPFLFAGGLNSENVANVVRRLRPFGVDVASGVEEQIGKKSPEKLQAFCRAVKTKSTIEAPLV